MPNGNVLSTQPYKGTQDFFPEDMRVRRHIFETWRKVCESFGYEEYQTPLMEEAAIYRAKSGDEVGGKELFTLTDLAGRELAIRPEMTPSVTRMVARRYAQWAKPIRLFNISNFARNERPQRGRNREFWQLNFDIFGEGSHLADVEILWMALEIMDAFNPPSGSFVVKLNSRKLINSFLETLKIQASDKVLVTRLMDKYEKLTEVEFAEYAVEVGVGQEDLNRIYAWMQLDSLPTLTEQFPEISQTEGYQELLSIYASIRELGYSEDRVVFAPGLVRGFDYYDGMVFEVFDTHPENTRSLFGGGRYNGLAGLFGIEPFPAVGCAPGDETLALFLRSWDIVPQKSHFVVFVPQLTDSSNMVLQTAHQLRYTGIAVVNGLKKVSIVNALKEADQKGYEWVVLLGQDEVTKGDYTLKNMKTGDQSSYPSVEEIAKVIQSSR